MGFETNHMTVTTHANYIKTVWSKEVIIAAEANLVITPLVWRFDTEAKLGGTIVVPNLSGMTAQDKAASTALTFDVTTESATNITINKHKYVAFLEEDALAAQTEYNLAALRGKKAGYELSAAIDSDVGGLATSLTNSVGTYNTDALSDADMLESIRLLDDANAPDTERAFVFKPSIKKHIFQAHDKFFDASIRGDSKNPVVTGNFGTFYGIPAYISTNVYSSGDNDSNMLLHKDALALALNMKKGIESQRIIEYLADAYVVQALYGVRVMRADFGVQIKS